MIWNGFKGHAKRLDDIDLPLIGRTIGVGEDGIHAVMDVEAAGSGFDSQGRPRILFERHWFYRNLSGASLALAQKQGLAVKKWSRATYGKDQYALLEQAMRIDETAALKSASWGLGQIMGFNHKLAGYDTVQAMVQAFMEDEENQLRGMINFIKSAGLDDELRRHDWAGFAKGYNGPGYKANKYDAKLAASFAKWSKIKDTPIPTEKPAEAQKPTPAPTHPTDAKPAPLPRQQPKSGNTAKGAALAVAGAATILATYWHEFTHWIGGLFQ